MADPLFQPPDLLAERRLGYSQSASGSAKMLFLGQYDESMKLPQIELGAKQIIAPEIWWSAHCDIGPIAGGGLET